MYIFMVETINPFISEKTTKQRETILYTCLYVLLKSVVFVWTHHSAYCYSPMLSN